jgi:hypothetical protein
VQQQAEVITAVSQFRAQAQQAGNLQSDERQIVEADQGAIRIRPADPQIIYVPQYEPAQVLVYQPAPVLRYYPRPCPVYYYPYDRGYPSGFPYFWGVSSAFSIGWRTHSVHVREHDHYDHAYYDNPYRGHYYRRRHHGHDGDQYYAYDRDHHQDYGRDDGNHGNESGRHDSHERRDHPRGERPDRGREYVWEPSRGRGGHLQQSRPRTIATTGHPTMLGNVGTTDPRNITLAPFLGGQRTEPQLPLRPSARARGAEAAITERRALPRNLGIVGPQAPSMPRQVRELDPAPNARDSSLNGREVSVTAMRPPASGIMIPSTSSSGYQPPRVPPAHDAQPGRRVGQSTPAFVIPHTSRVPQPTRGLDRTRTRPVIASDNRPLAAAPTRVPASGIMVPGTSVGGYAPQQVPSRREALPERRARAAEVEIPRGYSMPVPVERPIFESRSESPSQRDFSRAAPRVSRPDVRTDSARAWNGMRQATERRMTERRRER